VWKLQREAEVAGLERVAGILAVGAGAAPVGRAAAVGLIGPPRAGTVGRRGCREQARLERLQQAVQQLVVGEVIVR
jgi:hypothetical protein